MKKAAFAAAFLLGFGDPIVLFLYLFPLSFWAAR